MPVGLTLSPVIGIMFIEDFEEVALNRAARKPLYWLCYVYGT
jgi:hypothetical protein